MSVKKVVSSEPIWEHKRNRNVRKTGKDGKYCSVYICSAGEKPNGSKKLHAVFVFGEKYANLFGEDRLVFSSIADPKRIYFKFDDDGYKCQRNKRSCRVQFSIDDKTASVFNELWCSSGREYEVKKEREFYYIEREDPLEALFKDNGDQKVTVNEEPTAIAEIDLTESSPIIDEPKAQVEPPTGTVWMTPMPESGIKDKKVLAVLARMKDKGFVGVRDLKYMNMTDREYYKAANEICTMYGYAVVDVPCVDYTGRKLFVKALYNGTGEWE